MTCYNCGFFNICGDLKHKLVQVADGTKTQLINVNNVEKFCEHRAVSYNPGTEAMMKCVAARDAAKMQYKISFGDEHELNTTDFDAFDESINDFIERAKNKGKKVITIKVDSPY